MCVCVCVCEITFDLLTLFHHFITDYMCVFIYI